MWCGVVLVGLAACIPDARPVLEPPAAVVEVASFSAVPLRDLDLLFLLDDTESSGQQSLRDSMATLLAGLAFVEGGLPNLHVGVATSDLGTTGSLEPDNPAPAVGLPGQGGCAGLGDGGVLRTNGALVSGSFVVDEADGLGGRARNYTGVLEQVLGLMTSVGASGCGFEQHLAATVLALTNPANAGFVRPDANLAIIILADEDDCSVRDAGAFFDADEGILGPRSSFRCTREGLVCSESLDAVGPKTGCSPREDSSYLEGIERFVGFFDRLKPSQKLVLAGIVGDPVPVEVRNVTLNGTSELALSSSCSIGGVSASPAVRIAALVDRYASRGVLTTICQPDLAPNLVEIGMAIKRSMGVACIDTSKLADSRDDSGIQPVCEVHDLDSSGLATTIPGCPSEGSCYELRADPQACPETADHVRVVVTRDEPPLAGTRVDVRCELAQ